MAAGPSGGDQKFRTDRSDGRGVVKILHYVCCAGVRGLGRAVLGQRSAGLFTGLTRGANVRHLVRAALESMAYRTKDVFDLMQKESGRKIRALNVDGGACKNDFLMRFQADILGCRIMRPKMIDLTAQGASYLAGVTIGWVETAKKIWPNCAKRDVPCPEDVRRLGAATSFTRSGRKRSMPRDIAKSTYGQYDPHRRACGINGAAMAHMAARNGLKVALLEKNDLASGTSSKSTKLIHGGLRYLETFDLDLVRESLRSGPFYCATPRIWSSRFPLSFSFTAATASRSG